MVEASAELTDAEIRPSLGSDRLAGRHPVGVIKAPLLAATVRSG